ncbi:acyl-CoA thioester hydrolase/BAAT C-terminal domain-containing protein [Nonomuraea sp. NPDC000554]|uniref:acyl-CoA thioester hydrolase/BAAT C-terminal domain-containing protein n=1 Tax=Nonomuraea sp. NPDC000554 TaxID=3154259 RepID=UPI003326DB2A
MDETGRIAGLTELVEREIGSPWQGFLAEPRGGGRSGVLVLSGSSGRIERERCRVLAAQGVTALSIRWFGGPGQAPGICEIPLETFTAAIDLLRERGLRRISALGLSKGAEAVLLLATLDQRLDAVIAISPTSVAWANVGAGLDGVTRPYRSSWTWRGAPVPYVGYDEGWQPAEPEGEPVAFRGLYERSRAGYAEAAIPVEAAGAELLLVAGGDDQMWPSLTFAGELARRREARIVSGADAGHRPRLPGESPASPSSAYAYGGTPEADAALGAAAWPHLVELVTGRTGRR